jgi:hypothetical protein
LTSQAEPPVKQRSKVRHVSANAWDALSECRSGCGDDEVIGLIERVVKRGEF